MKSMNPEVSLVHQDAAYSNLRVHVHATEEHKLYIKIFLK